MLLLVTKSKTKPVTDTKSADAGNVVDVTNKNAVAATNTDETYGAGIDISATSIAIC